VPLVVSLPPNAIELFDRQRELHVATPARRLPIWAVVVDDEVYVRSYRGERGAWYRRALRDGRMTLEGIDVCVEPEHDSELNERISDAFRAKYGAHSPASTETMVSPEVVATTLRLKRAE
jgi:hypothetical protein